MKEHVCLIAAGNTYNPCLLLLRSKGYHVWAEGSGDRILWNASNDSCSCAAYSPPELLGIVSLFEGYGPDWNRQTPNLLSELMREQAAKEETEGQD
jgi:carbohydrate-binding DOMON domain-containing protein